MKYTEIVNLQYIYIMVRMCIKCTCSYVQNKNICGRPAVNMKANKYKSIARMKKPKFYLRFRN